MILVLMSMMTKLQSRLWDHECGLVVFKHVGGGWEQVKRSLFPKVQLAFYRDDFGCLRRTVVFSSTQALSLLYTLCEWLLLFEVLLSNNSWCLDANNTVTIGNKRPY